MDAPGSRKRNRLRLGATFIVWPADDRLYVRGGGCKETKRPRAHIGRSSGGRVSFSDHVLHVLFDSVVGFLGVGMLHAARLQTGKTNECIMLLYTAMSSLMAHAKIDGGEEDLIPALQK